MHMCSKDRQSQTGMGRHLFTLLLLCASSKIFTLTGTEVIRLSQRHAEYIRCASARAATYFRGYTRPSSRKPWKLGRSQWCSRVGTLGRLTRAGGDQTGTPMYVARLA